MLCFTPFFSRTQHYADPSYYLVDSLDLSLLNLEDIELLDSFLAVYHKTKEDTSKIAIIYGMIENTWSAILWPVYSQWEIDYATAQLNRVSKLTQSEKFAFKDLLRSGYNNLGLFENQHNNDEKAYAFYKQALKVSVDLPNDPSWNALILNNIGGLLINFGKLEDAINVHYKALALRESVADSSGIGQSYNNISAIYSLLGNLSESEVFLRKSIQIRKLIGDEMGYAISMNRLAIIESNQKKYRQALVHIKEALAIFVEYGNVYGEANALYTIGEVLVKQGDPFAQPVQVYSNINEGFGIFGGASFYQDTLFL